VAEQVDLASVEGEEVTPEAVDTSRPAPDALVARGDEDVFRVMDAMDEEQILDALQGRPSQVMVYSFKPKGGGKTQTGLSWQGVAEVVRTMNQARQTAIRVSPEVAPLATEVQEPDHNGELVTYIRVTVYAEDTLNGGGNWGTATQAKFQTFRDPDRKPQLDPFAFTKALSKAQRNAELSLTPVVFRETLIAQLLGDRSRVRQIRSGDAGPVAELPPPLTDERALAQKDSARELFRAVQAIDRLALMPAQFHTYLSRAEHSHQRLDEFIAYLQDKLEEVKRAQG